MKQRSSTLCFASLITVLKCAILLLSLISINFPTARGYSAQELAQELQVYKDKFDAKPDERWSYFMTVFIYSVESFSPLVEKERKAQPDKLAFNYVKQEGESSKWIHRSLDWFKLTDLAPFVNYDEAKRSLQWEHFYELHHLAHFVFPKEAVPSKPKNFIKFEWSPKTYVTKIEKIYDNMKKDINKWKTASKPNRKKKNQAVLTPDQVHRRKVLLLETIFPITSRYIETRDIFLGSIVNEWSKEKATIQTLPDYPHVLLAIVYQRSGAVNIEGNLKQFWKYVRTKIDCPLAGDEEAFGTLTRSAVDHLIPPDGVKSFLEKQEPQDVEYLLVLKIAIKDFEEMLKGNPHYGPKELIDWLADDFVQWQAGKPSTTEAFPDWDNRLSELYAKSIRQACLLKIVKAYYEERKQTQTASGKNDPFWSYPLKLWNGLPPLYRKGIAYLTGVAGVVGGLYAGYYAISRTSTTPEIDPAFETTEPPPPFFHTLLQGLLLLLVVICVIGVGWLLCKYNPSSASADDDDKKKKAEAAKKKEKKKGNRDGEASKSAKDSGISSSGIDSRKTSSSVASKANSSAIDKKSTNIDSRYMSSSVDSKKTSSTDTGSATDSNRRSKASSPNKRETSKQSRPHSQHSASNSKGGGGRDRGQPSRTSKSARRSPNKSTASPSSKSRKDPSKKPKTI